jgi:hypothetical protein
MGIGVRIQLQKVIARHAAQCSGSRGSSSTTADDWVTRPHAKRAHHENQGYLGAFWFIDSSAAAVTGEAIPVCCGASDKTRVFRLPSQHEQSCVSCACKAASTEFDLGAGTKVQCYVGIRTDKMTMRKICNAVVKYSTIAGLFVSWPGLAGEREGWLSLFDGKTLSGWRIDGKADWSVQDGAIVGRHGGGAAGGNLYTVRQWADFDLETEFKVRWPANSGIWFRRNDSQPGYQADILHQPQYPDALTGSLVAMGSGFLVKNSNASTIDEEGWNRMRITAACDSIAIALSGKVVVKTSDSRFLKPGSIGIEVHGGEQFKGMEIWVRQIRLRPAACQAK